MSRRADAHYRRVAQTAALPRIMDGQRTWVLPPEAGGLGLTSSGEPITSQAVKNRSLALQNYGAVLGSVVQSIATINRTPISLQEAALRYTRRVGSLFRYLREPSSRPSATSYRLSHIWAEVVLSNELPHELFTAFTRKYKGVDLDGQMTGACLVISGRHKRGTDVTRAACMSCVYQRPADRYPNVGSVTYCRRDLAASWEFLTAVTAIRTVQEDELICPPPGAAGGEPDVPG